MSRRTRRREQASKALRVHGAKGIMRTEKGTLTDWHEACRTFDALAELVRA